MIAHHVHHALTQIKELQQQILEKQRFRGYSGPARAFSGAMALFAASVMNSSAFPQTETAHLAGWGVVFLAAIILNFSALMYWFLFDSVVKSEVRRLGPLLDVSPSIFVGSVLTLVMLARGTYDSLFGTWMCLFGLANVASRHVLPRAIAWLGLYYISCGTACLTLPELNFLNPWPMGIVFFIGEWIGGLVLYFDGKRTLKGESC